eukprot:7450686-Lingulodinium_polyedra.AAC.1
MSGRACRRMARRPRSDPAGCSSNARACGPRNRTRTGPTPSGWPGRAPPGLASPACQRPTGRGPGQDPPRAP